MFGISVSFSDKIQHVEIYIIFLTWAQYNHTLQIVDKTNTLYNSGSY
jgi:hypothetical protein